MDQYFSHNLMAPADLNDLVSHVARQMMAVLSPTISHVQRRALLLGGASSAVRPADLGAVRDVPVLPPGPLTGEVMQRRLDQLIMPDEQAAAREPFIEQLNLDVPSDLTWELLKLQTFLPEATTALLELRIGRAYELMRANPVCQQNVAAARYLLVGIAKVRVAYWLRTLAMRCGAQLHRPYGFDLLDQADRPGMVRYAPVYDRLHHEGQRLQGVVDMFRSGSSDSLRGSGANIGLPLRELMPGCWNRSGIDSTSAWEAIVWRALVQWAHWRGVHGEDLEALVAAMMDMITAWLGQFWEHMVEQAPTRRTRNTRVANLGGVSTLVVLFNATRFAIAWTNEGGGGRAAANASGSNSGIDRLIDWRIAARPGGPCPFPTLEKDRGHTVLQTFTLLRYVFVEDDNMLPHALQRVGGIRHLKSQADAEKVLGRKFSFDELWSALPMGGAIGNEISRAANVRGVKSLGDMDSAMQEAVGTAMWEFIVGVTGR